jgi:hypothetical protein
MDREVGRTFSSLAVVMVTTVLVLHGLDALPGYLAGRAHGVKGAATLEEAERTLGFTIWLPAFFPDSLLWPPASIEYTDAATPSVAIRFLASAGREPGLLLSETIGKGDAPPPDLFPRGVLLTRATVRVREREGTLARVELPGGWVVHDLVWRSGERLLAMRYTGTVDELLLLAGSLEARRP